MHTINYSNHQHCYDSYLQKVLTLMLLVAKLANTKQRKNHEKLQKPWHMGTHLSVLNESYQMNTNMTGLSLALEPGCPKLAIAKFWGTLFLSLRLQPQTFIYFLR